MGKISMSMVQSNGTYLKGCLAPQRHFIHLEVNTEKGEFVSEVYLTLEQFTTLLVGGRSECTLHKYITKDGFQEEKVEPPQSIEERMNEKLGVVHKELLDRMADIKQTVYEMLNGGKKGKGAMEDLLREVDTLASHFTSNQKFYVEQANAEAKEVLDNLCNQVEIELQNKGVGVKIPSFIGTKLLEERTQPVLTNYVPKQFEKKSIDEMTAKEVADELSELLKKFESKVVRSENGEYAPVSLYCAHSWEERGSVGIRYVNYQTTSKLSLEDARKYLKGLSESDKFISHYNFLRKEDIIWKE